MGGFDPSGESRLESWMGRLSIIATLLGQAAQRAGIGEAWSRLMAVIGSTLDYIGAMFLLTRIGARSSAARGLPLYGTIALARAAKLYSTLAALSFAWNLAWFIEIFEMGDWGQFVLFQEEED